MDLSDHSVLADGLKPISGYMPAVESSIDRECEKHGPYKELTVSFAGRSVVNGCPACMGEKHDQEQRIRTERNRIEANRVRLERLFNQSCVPPIFKDAGFENYELSQDPEIRAGQKIAVSACRSFAEHFDLVLQNRGNLLLVGNEGTGKSHLTCAISNHLVTQGRSCLFINPAAIARKMISARSYSSDVQPDDVMHELSSLDLLIIDELEEFRNEDERTILIDLIDARYKNKLPTVATSNLSLDDLRDKLSVKSIDRLSHKGTLIPFHWNSHRPIGNKGDHPWMLP